MERLTFEGLFCDIAQCVGQPGNTSECPGGYCSQRRTWEKLKEYEDTGLSPEEVKTMAQDIETRFLLYVEKNYGIDALRILDAIKESRAQHAPPRPEKEG